jgi:hypothetical protein
LVSRVPGEKPLLVENIVGPFKNPGINNPFAVMLVHLLGRQHLIYM